MKSLKPLLEHLWKPVALALGLALATSTLPAAQCLTPDNLDNGPCCAPTLENVPWFQKTVQNSLEICWSDCGVNAVLPYTARWSPLKILPSTGPDCGYHQSRLDLIDGGGIQQWTGVMRLLYSRTWVEVGTSGALIQVWRFLVNGDLRAASTLGPAPCPLPPCALAFGGRVKFTGYIDYADDCGTAAGPTIAWMLTHACDPIDHAPGFPRAGAFHPGRSYTFVGPGAGFVPAPLVPAEGVAAFTPFEAVRRLIYPALGTTGPITCEFEERAGHFLNPVAPLCFCSVGLPLSQQWNLGNLNIFGSCGTTVTTPGGPQLPGFLSMGIGTWTIPAVYPGVESLRWNVGNYNYTEGCTGALRNEVFYGVTTLGGYPASAMTAGGPGAPLPLTFIDQANAIRTGGGVVMNVPYLSDHVLNLNH